MHLLRICNRVYIHCVSEKDTTQPPTIILTIVVRFQQFLIQILLSKYAIERWFDINDLDEIRQIQLGQTKVGSFRPVSILHLRTCLRCFDAVFWAAGRASGLKKP